jgi:YhcH/YjgK/YiaL family protein
MIIDTLDNASKYFSVHPLFAQAFAYLQTTDWSTAADGKFDIAEGLKSIVNTAAGKTKEASLEKFECHNKNIDIQFCISGTEHIGWKPRQKCVIEKGGYNEEKDVLYYGDAPDMYFTLQGGQFVILFPEDVHAPMIGEGEIKKTVIKVKI